MMSEKQRLEIEDIEINLLIEAIKQRCGYDFSDYTLSHIKRRIKMRLDLSDFKNITQIIEQVLYDDDFLTQILRDLSINVSEMFRFPEFYKTFRKQVIPLLKTYPSLKIWHAGCARGEEVYSMAILLKEEGLLENTQIFATDINREVLKDAKEGIYSLKEVRKWTENYQKSGGLHSFSDYYTARFDSVIFNNELIKNVKFFEHNLVTDKSFIQAHIVICRNVIIYFNKTLQERVFQLFHDSIVPGGFLGLGSKEHMKFSAIASQFEKESNPCKIFRKKYKGEKS